MLEHAAEECAGARVSGGFVVVIPAACFEVAAAVVEHAVIAGASCTVAFVDRRFRWVDEEVVLHG